VRPNLPLLALVAAAAALALVAAYASVTSDKSYYAYGDITADKEAVDIKVYAKTFSLPAGSQGTKSFTNFTEIVRQGDVQNVKLLVRWVNAKQVASHFDYIQILLVDDNNQVKGLLTPRKPAAMLTFDNDDFGSDNAINITAVVYFEGKEGVMFQNLPLIFNVKLLQTS